MKKIAGLLLILVVLVLGSYYIMGVTTEHSVKNSIEVVNKSNGLVIEILDYHRGWFKSDASLRWKLHIPEREIATADGKSKTMPAQDFQMKMPVDIYHGPVIFADKAVRFGLGYAKSNIPLPEEYNQQFNSSFTAESTKPQLDLSLFINYLNNGKLEFTIPDFKLIAKQGNSRFEWKGMDSSIGLSSSGKKVDGDLTIDGLTASKDDVTMETGKIKSEYNLHKSLHELYLGDVSISFPSLVVKDKAKTLFELSNFDFYTESDAADGLFYSNVKLSGDKIIVRDKTYGPGKLEMSLKNLDAEVLADIHQQANSVQQGTDAEKQKVYLAILTKLPKLLSRGPEFDSKLNLVVPEGTIEANLFVSLPKGEPGNPFELMQKIQGKGKVKVPAAVLRQVLNAKNVATLSKQTPPVTDLVQEAAALTEKQLTAMTQSGLLVQQGTDFVLEANYEKTKLVINGKAFNPAMMQF